LISKPAASPLDTVILQTFTSTQNQHSHHLNTMPSSHWTKASQVSAIGSGKQRTEVEIDVGDLGIGYGMIRGKQLAAEHMV